MLYLGIDQSLRAAGFALVDEKGNYVDSYTVSVGSDIKGAERLYNIQQCFYRFLEDYGKYEIRAAREGYAVKAVNRPFDLGMVAGVLDVAYFHTQRREPIIVPPTSLKKFATGNAMADKVKMLYCVKEQLGVDLEDRDDEADAVFLALFARAVDKQEFTSRAAAEAVYSLVKPSKKPKIRKTSTKNNI